MTGVSDGIVSGAQRRWNRQLIDDIDDWKIDAELTPNAAGAVLDAVHDRGFALIESRPALLTEASINQRREELLAFGAALGTPIMQSPRRELVEDVKDFSETERDDRGYRSRGELSAHSDPPTLVVLHCVQAAKSGGESAIVSVASIVERLMHDDPNLVDILQTDFPTWQVAGEFARSEEGPGDTGRPVLTVHDGRFSCVVYRPFIERAAAASGTPLSPAQVVALDAWERASMSADLTLRFVMRPGQTLILHNRSVLHARTDYEDWPEINRRRHLLRLWLDAPNEFATDPRHALGDAFAVH